MSTVEKKLNFFKNDVFYIHGNFDDTITTEIIPELRNKITKIIRQQDDINTNKNLTKEEQNKQLERLQKDEKITFDINSNGGDVYILFALLNSINFAKSKSIIVETYCHYAASCASMLAIHGTKKHRYIGTLSFHYIHQGSYWIYSQNQKELDRRYKTNTHWFNVIKKLYIDNTLYTENELREIMDAEHYQIYSEDILKYGLADKIL